jgi:putative hydrolase of the HAD superfamily
MTARDDATSGGASSPPRAVFFDAGFTLIHPTRPVVELYCDAAREVSGTRCDAKLREEFQRAWSEGTRDAREDHRSSDELERARWHRFTRRIAETVPELLPHHEAWLERLRGHFDDAQGWRLAPQAREILQDLRARGLRVGIVSNWHAGLHRIVSGMGLHALVDFVVCSADVGFRKPHPRIFHEALRASGIAAAATIHVGDTWSEDVVGALAAGIAAVHLSSGPPRPGTAHRTIADLSELATIL